MVRWAPVCAGLAELQQTLDAAAAEKEAAQEQLEQATADRDDLEQALKQRIAERDAAQGQLQQRTADAESAAERAAAERAALEEEHAAGETCVRFFILSIGLCGVLCDVCNHQMCLTALAC